MVWKINDIHIPREKWQRVKWLYDYYKGKYSEGLLNRKSKKVLGGWICGIKQKQEK